MSFTQSAKPAVGVRRAKGASDELGIMAFFDPELFDEIKEYAARNKLSLAKAVSELTTVGLETIKQDKTNATILRIRENERALKMAKAFDFTQDCYACGRSGTLRRIHGHVQCKSCGANVEPCCDD